MLAISRLRVSNKMAYRVHCLLAVIHALLLVLVVANDNSTARSFGQRAVTVITGDAKRTVPVSQLVNSMYPQRIAGRHQTGVSDPAMVLDLVLAQQRWRRVDKAKGLLVSEPHAPRARALVYYSILQCW
jgi:hypothetical protein